MESGLDAEQLVGFAFFDSDRSPCGVRVGYLPRDTPGLDLHDSRAIGYRGRSYPSQI